MYNKQVPITKKWQPPLSDKIMRIVKSRKEITPLSIALNLGLRQSTVSMSMIVLHRDGLLDRKLCPCGAGFIYSVRKNVR